MDERQVGRLVELASGGDEEAVQSLVVHYHGVLSNVVGGATDERLQQRIDPSDVLQRAYVAVFEVLRRGGDDDAGLRFDGPGHFYKWLEQVALNQLRDMQRGLRRQKRDVAREVDVEERHDPATSYPNLLHRLAGGEPTPSRHMACDEAVAAVMSCLARLEDDQREVVRLRFLEDVGVSEIARRLGKTETAVYTLCHRGLKSLRGLMVSLTNYLTSV